MKLLWLDVGYVRSDIGYVPSDIGYVLSIVGCVWLDFLSDIGYYLRVVGCVQLPVLSLLSGLDVSAVVIRSVVRALLFLASLRRMWQAMLLEVCEPPQLAQVSGSSRGRG